MLTTNKSANKHPLLQGSKKQNLLLLLAFTLEANVSQRRSSPLASSFQLEVSRALLNAAKDTLALVECAWNQRSRSKDWEKAEASVRNKYYKYKKMRQFNILDNNFQPNSFNHCSNHRSMLFRIWIRISHGTLLFRNHFTWRTRSIGWRKCKKTNFGISFWKTSFLSKKCWRGSSDSQSRIK